MNRIRTFLAFLIAPLAAGAFFMLCLALFDAFTESTPVLYAIKDKFSDMSTPIFPIAYAFTLFISTPIYFLLKYLFVKTHKRIRLWHVVGGAALSTLAPILVLVVPVLILGVFQVGVTLKGGLYSVLFIMAIAASGALGGLTLWLVGGNPNSK